MAVRATAAAAALACGALLYAAFALASPSQVAETVSFAVRPANTHAVLSFGPEEPCTDLGVPRPATIVVKNNRLTRRVLVRDICETHGTFAQWATGSIAQEIRFQRANVIYSKSARRNELLYAPEARAGELLYDEVVVSGYYRGRAIGSETLSVEHADGYRPKIYSSGAQALQFKKVCSKRRVYVSPWGERFCFGAARTYTKVRIAFPPIALTSRLSAQYQMSVDRGNHGFGLLFRDRTPMVNVQNLRVCYTSPRIGRLCTSGRMAGAEWTDTNVAYDDVGKKTVFVFYVDGQEVATKAGLYRILLRR